MSFKSWQSYWKFSQEVRRGSRYMHGEDVKDFLSNVLETSKARETPVKPGSVFWRAQLGSERRSIIQDGEEVGDEPVPFSPPRMKPLLFEASEGRVNPQGIPCLYLATKKETAMAEVRPGLHSDISVGQFRTVKELKLINCAVHPPDGLTVYWEEPDDQKKEKAVWADIDRAFSQPVTQSDKSSEYVPTQIIAELFKSNGFDGVFYRSAPSVDLNLALFDIDAATILNCVVYEAEKIQFSFKQSSNGYSL